MFHELAPGLLIHAPFSLIGFSLFEKVVEYEPAGEGDGVGLAFGEGVAEGVGFGVGEGDIEGVGIGVGEEDGEGEGDEVGVVDGDAEGVEVGNEEL